jgi:ABC-type amino acid transport system permease subunit
VLFQAVKAIYPALASQFVLLLLATSVVSSIGATELFNTRPSSSTRAPIGRSRPTR